MRKIFISMVVTIFLCVPALFAQGGEHKIYSVNYGSATTTAITIHSGTSDVAYIVVDSTGLTASTTIRILNGSTTAFALTLGTSVKTITIDLTNTPVYFSGALIVDSSAMDSAANVMIVYRKRN